VLETAPVGPQEGAHGQSFTVLCFPRACTVAPGSGITTQLLVTRSRQSQKGKLNIVSVKQANTKVEQIWAES